MSSSSHSFDVHPPVKLQFISDSIALYHYDHHTILNPSNRDASVWMDHNFTRIFGPLLQSYTMNESIHTKQQHYIDKSSMPTLSTSTTNSFPQTGHKIYVTLLFDPAVRNWKEYLYQIQAWIHETNEQRHQQNNDWLLLSTMCRCNCVYPLELFNIYRTDVIQNMTVSNMVPSTDHTSTMNHSEPYQYRYISTNDQKMKTVLSDYISQDTQHILLYIPYETTVFWTTSQNSTTTTTPTSSVEITIGSDSTTLHTKSYLRIMNPNSDISTVIPVLDQLYNQYYWNCLNVVHIVEPTDSSKGILTLFYMKIYFHRTFYLWYESLLDRLEYISTEMVDLQTNYSNYVYSAWSTISLLSLAQLNMNRILHNIVEWDTAVPLSSSFWLYSTNFHETYQRLQQLDESIQKLENDISDMKRIAKQNQSRIIDLEVLIHDIPVEQYMAIFGPLLFPLVLPLLITLIREHIRYRKRRITSGG